MKYLLYLCVYMKEEIKLEILKMAYSIVIPRPNLLEWYIEDLTKAVEEITKVYNKIK